MSPPNPSGPYGLPSFQIAGWWVRIDLHSGILEIRPPDGNILKYPSTGQIQPDRAEPQEQPSMPPREALALPPDGILEDTEASLAEAKAIEEEMARKARQGRIEAWDPSTDDFRFAIQAAWTNRPTASAGVPVTLEGVCGWLGYKPHEVAERIQLRKTYQDAQGQTVPRSKQHYEQSLVHRRRLDYRFQRAIDTLKSLGWSIDRMDGLPGHQAFQKEYQVVASPTDSPSSSTETPTEENAMKAQVKDHPAERLFAWLQRALGPSWTQRMQEALAAAGCPKPAQTARSLAAFNSGWDNQSLSHAFAFEEAVPPSTMSDRFSALDLDKFVKAFNAGLERDTRKLLATFPPDGGRVILVGDGHDEEYHETREPTGWIPKDKTRWFYKTYATAKNKTTAYAAKYLFLMAKWHHQKCPVKSLLMVRLIGPLDVHPTRRIQFMAGPIRRLSTEYQVLTLDRYYGNAKSLRLAYELGLRLGVRLSIPSHYPKWAWDRTGRAFDVLQELRRAATMKHLPVSKVELESKGSKTGKRLILVKRRNLQARLWQEGPVYSIIIETALVPVQSDGGPVWACDLRDSRILCFPSTMTASQAVLLYHERESIEMFFSQATHDRSSCRPKRVESMLVQYYAYLYRIQIGIVAQFLLSLACPTGRFRGNPVTRYSAYALSRHCLGISRNVKHLRPRPTRAVAVVSLNRLRPPPR